MSKKVKWHKGPPPSIGWWPASAHRVPGLLRWWNGRYWSAPANVYLTSKQVAEKARTPTQMTRIQWQHRPASWPKRSFT